MLLNMKLDLSLLRENEEIRCFIALRINENFFVIATFSLGVFKLSH